MACLPNIDPAHGVLSVRDNPEWRRATGQPLNSWVGKIDRSCQDQLRMDRAAEWELTQRGCLRWSQLVSEAMYPLAYAPHKLVSW